MVNSFTPFFLLLPLLVLTLTTTLVVVVKGAPDLTFVSAFCGWDHDDGDYRKNQATRLADTAIGLAGPGVPVCSVTAEEKGNPLMYSRASCSGSVSTEDCTACITYAKDQLLKYNICHDQYGAQITVASCSFRYETYEMVECPFSVET